MDILVDTGATTITKTWYVNGVATDVGDVTIGIDDSDGNEVVASGTPTTNVGSGVYTYDLAVQTQVKQLVVTWTDTASQSLTDDLEIIGDWLFTINELRTFHNSDLVSTSTYPTADLADLRDEITREFEQICGVSFVPRFRRQSMPGEGGYVLEVDRGRVSTVIACTVSTVSVTVGNLIPDDITPFIHRTDGLFTRPTTASPKNVVISYRHGYEVIQLSVKRAALIAAHARAKKDITGAGIPYNASSWNDGTGQFVSYAPNDKTMRWFGIPEVDIVLRQHMERIPVFG